jgi:hypothetical protein
MKKMKKTQKNATVEDWNKGFFDTYLQCHGTVFALLETRYYVRLDSNQKHSGDHLVSRIDLRLVGVS